MTFFKIMDEIAKRQGSYHIECKSSLGTVRDDIIYEEQLEESKMIKVFQSVLSEQESLRSESVAFNCNEYITEFIDLIRLPWIHPKDLLTTLKSSKYFNTEHIFEAL